jgi:hypothetical protein
MRLGFRILLCVFAVVGLIFLGWLVNHLFSVLGALGL